MIIQWLFYFNVGYFILFNYCDLWRRNTMDCNKTPDCCDYFMYYSYGTNLSCNDSVLHCSIMSFNQGAIESFTKILPYPVVLWGFFFKTTGYDSFHVDMEHTPSAESNLPETINNPKATVISSELWSSLHIILPCRCFLWLIHIWIIPHESIKSLIYCHIVVF